MSGLGAGPTNEAIGFSRNMLFSFFDLDEGVGEGEGDEAGARFATAAAPRCRPLFRDASSFDRREARSDEVARASMRGLTRSLTICI